MKKIVPNIAGVLLGLIFVMASVVVLFKLAPMPKLPPESPIGKFMDLFGSSGYLTYVKVFELLGGITVMIPKLRNFGLLILGPIIVNIFAVDIFIVHGDLLNPMFDAAVVLSLFLLWHARKQFAGLMN